jgi:Gnt-I system high-affinity gluconate transporter
MLILTVFISIIFLLCLMVFLRLDAFFSLLIASLCLGLMNGIPLLEILGIIEDGIGSQLGHLILVIGFGAILGKLLEESGATKQIAHKMLTLFGESRANIAILVVAFIVGLPLFFEVGFILLIPIVYTLVKKLRVPLISLGLPMSVALSATHSFLPPHPGPLAVTQIFEANLGLVLIYGIIIAVPAVFITGYVFPKFSWIKRLKATIPDGLITEKETSKPLSFSLSLSIVLLPILLITILAIFDSLSLENSRLYPIVEVIGESTVALFISIVYAIILMMFKQHLSIKELQPFISKSFTSISMIIIVIAAGGAYKEMIVYLKVDDYLEGYLSDLQLSPYILAWVVTALLRFSLGSATVTVMTASSIMLPLLSIQGISPELLVLSVTTGSVALSHVNDPGFWMYKQYFNLSIQDAIMSRTVYTTILSIVGIVGVYVLNLIL